MLRIREILKEKGWSNSDLQIRLQGISQDEKPLSKQYISNVVNGRQTVSMSRLSDIAKALEVDVWQLFANPAEICHQTKCDDFVAMIRFRGNLYQAGSIEELEMLIAGWKADISEN